jgi:sortase (surface protein transpeptidase)
VARNATPLHLSIPCIGVDTALISLGLQDDGTVEVPTDPAAAGWFRLGTVPGRRGSSVILGHVDSVDGPAVFAGLSTMRPRDRVQVVLSDDSLMTFAVTGIETYANADFPADRVYAGTTRRRELNLVTCGGEYDAGRGGYQSNVVVFTRRART